MNERTLYLCGGLQSSGSTLVSWCFLQRPDMDGVLDAPFDSLPVVPQLHNGDRPWCKFTIACFRFADVKQHLEDDGWTIRPLLVARDLRAVFNSLVHKKYGRNGTTADDPPLRLRLRRFHEDWQLFRDQSWPILRYEDFAAAPVPTLRAACESLGLPWDDAMVTWPKDATEIAAASNGNATFAETRGLNLIDSIRPSLARVKTDQVPPADLEWMEEEFADMNASLGYPAHIPSQAPAEVPKRAIPTFDCTRKHSLARRAIRRYRRNRWLIALATLLLALTVLADVKDWIRCIDFF